MPTKFSWPPWKNQRPSPSQSDTPKQPEYSTSPELPQTAPSRFIDLPNVPPDSRADIAHASLTKDGFQASPRSEPTMSRRSSADLLGGSPLSRGKSFNDVAEASSSVSAEHKLVQSERPWQASPRHRWFVPMEQTVMHDETRKRVAQAASCALDLAGDASHSALLAGIEVMKYSPVPGLEAVGRVLLDIWDAVQQVVFNRMRCLRLAMRSADFLMSIREEIAELHDVVGRKLEQPLRRFEDTLFLIFHTLQEQIKLPGWERYIKREHLTEEIDNCNVALEDCLNSFDRSVMLRIAETTMTRRQSYNQPLLMKPGGEPQSLDRLDIPVLSLSPMTEEPEEDKLVMWRQLIQDDDKADAVRDNRDFQVLLEHAIYARDESKVIQLLQIGHSDLPAALKALLKEAFAIRRVKDEERASHRDGGRPMHPRSRSQTWPFDQPHPSGGNGPRRQPTTDSSESILHRLDSLRRERQGHPSVVRSWTIVREDVRLGDIIGRGHFSTVYKGIWRGRTVAVKVLNPETGSKSEFRNELTIWRFLSGKGSAVSKLYGSSAFLGDQPRILVSPYMRHGNLSDYLKRCEWEAAGETPALFLQRGPYDKVDHLKFMYDIARGMAFIHDNDVLHGDLRSANVLVNDSFKCVVADFGSSKFKSQVTFEDPYPNHAFRWQAPEIMQRRSLISMQGDVYSYALTCVEITTFGNIPWPTLPDDGVKEEVLRKKSRPPVSDLAKNLKIEPLLRACWNDAPASRMPFKDIIGSLQNLIRPPIEG